MISFAVAAKLDAYWRGNVPPEGPTRAIMTVYVDEVLELCAERLRVQRELAAHERRLSAVATFLGEVLQLNRVLESPWPPEYDMEVLRDETSRHEAGFSSEPWFFVTTAPFAIGAASRAVSEIANRIASLKARLLSLNCRIHALLGRDRTRRFLCGFVVRQFSFYLHHGAHPPRLSGSSCPRNPPGALPA